MANRQRSHDELRDDRVTGGAGVDVLVLTEKRQLADLCDRNRNRAVWRQICHYGQQPVRTRRGCHIDEFAPYGGVLLAERRVDQRLEGRHRKQRKVP